jgi:hypothetical protein
VRFIHRATLVRSGLQGRNDVRFTGRLRGKALPRGRYRARRRDRRRRQPVGAEHPPIQGRQAMRLRAATAALAALALGPVAPAAADHRDGPAFASPSEASRLDIGDLYVFRSLANASNTVLILTVSPFAGTQTPSAFRPNARFEFKLDTTGDAVGAVREDVTLRARFGAPDETGVQSVSLRCLPAACCPRHGVLAKGRTVLGNGRRLSDDVTNTELNVFSNGAIVTDNVGDDNGSKITDGSVNPQTGMTRAIAFPYVGAPS